MNNGPLCGLPTDCQVIIADHKLDKAAQPAKFAKGASTSLPPPTSTDRRTVTTMAPGEHVEVEMPRDAPATRQLRKVPVSTPPRPPSPAK